MSVADVNGEPGFDVVTRIVVPAVVVKVVTAILAVAVGVFGDAVAFTIVV